MRGKQISKWISMLLLIKKTYGCHHSIDFFIKYTLFFENTEQNEWWSTLLNLNIHDRSRSHIKSREKYTIRLQRAEHKIRILHFLWFTAVKSLLIVVGVVKVQMKERKPLNLFTFPGVQDKLPVMIGNCGAIAIANWI